MGLINSNSRQKSNDDIFVGAPNHQDKKVLKPFIENENSTRTQRQLDDFGRNEGYQSLSPRQLGVPGNSNNLEIANNSKSYKKKISKIMLVSVIIGLFLSILLVINYINK